MVSLFLGRNYRNGLLLSMRSCDSSMLMKKRNQTEKNANQFWLQTFMKYPQLTLEQKLNQDLDKVMLWLNYNKK